MMLDDYIFIGDFLKEAREEIGMSQDAVVEAMRASGYHSFNKTTLWRWENNDDSSISWPFVDALEAMMKVLEMTDEQIKVYARLMTHNYGKHYDVGRLAMKHRVQYERSGIFIGRTQEQQQIGEALQNRQSVLITGVGGIGKTSLAHKILEQNFSHFTHGCDTIRVGPHDKIETVIVTLSELLGSTLTMEDVLHDVDYELSKLKRRTIKADLLILLDNVSTLNQIKPLLTLPGITWIITSRLHLDAPQANLLRVMLTYPSVEEAMMMLLEHASLSQSETTESLAEKIVRRLGCFPIALRIAASLVTTGLVPDLEGLWDWLQKRGATALALEDDQTLFAFFAEILGMIKREDTLQLFELCGLFAKPQIARKRLQAVAEQLDYTIDLLGQLARLSIIQWGSQGQSVELHPLIHEYAIHRVQTSNQQTKLTNAFIRAYSNFAEEQLEQTLILEPEIDNLHLAVDRAITLDDWPLLRPLWNTVSTYLWDISDWNAYIPFDEKCLVVARAAGERLDEGLILSEIGYQLLDQGQFEVAEAYFQQARAIYVQLDALRDRLRILRYLGILYTKWGKLPQATELLEQAATLATNYQANNEPVEDWWAIGWALIRHAQADVARLEENYTLAEAQAREARDWCLKSEYQVRYLPMIEFRLGQSLFGLGRVQEAYDLWQNLAKNRATPLEERLLANVHLSLANYELSRDRQKSLFYAHRAKEVYSRIGLTEEVAQSTTMIERASKET